MAEHKLLKIKINDLKLYEKNSKIHSNYQVELLKKSIEEFGFVNPILIDEHNNVIAGHGRIEAAKQLKIKELPCIVVDGLTDIQRRAFIIADNRLSELGEWDEEIVARELKDLKESGFDTDLTGFLYDDMDFSFLDEKPKEKKTRKPSEKTNCECPRCKCIFRGSEIIEHGNETREESESRNLKRRDDSWQGKKTPKQHQ